MNWAYIAGFLDGEGCFTIYCRRRKTKSGVSIPSFEPRIVATNTNKEAMTKIAEFIGAYITPKMKHPRKSNWNPLWELVIENKATIKRVLENCLPYLIIKRKQAEILLELLSIKRGSGSYDLKLKRREFELYKLISELNKNSKRGREPRYKNWEDVIQIKPMVCKKCGYEWIPRKDFKERKTKQCPKCQTTQVLIPH